MVVGVGGEGEIGDGGAEVEHGGQLNAKFAGGVDGDAELECLANAGGFDAGADAAPEGGGEQDHVGVGVQDVGGELFKVDDDGVGRGGYPHELPNAAQGV